MFFSLNSTKVRIVILVIFLIFIWFTAQRFNTIPNKENSPNADQEINIDDTSKATFPKTKISVYYEALCPDSRNFFLKQLYPAYDKIPHLMEIILEPYGKAKTDFIDSQYVFECQHGFTECEANKIHACAIKYIQDKSLMLKYVSCMIDHNLYPEDIARSCSKQYDINVDQILRCARNPEGSELLKVHGDHTHELAPISFIPTILLDGSRDRQPAILKDLFKEICRKYETQIQVPIECS